MNARRRPRWLMASLAVLLGVCQLAPAGASQGVSDDSPSGDAQATAGGGTAPAWPFVGIVGKEYDPILDVNFLVYWNAENGTLSKVLLLDRQGKEWTTGCPGTLFEGRHGVRYTAYSLYRGSVEFVAPWGDDAYPILESERFIDFYAPPTTTAPREGDVNHLDIEMHYGVLRIDNSEAIAYYMLQYDPEAREEGLVRIDPREGSEIFETEASDDERIWGSIAHAFGSAGHYYGFEVVHSEPACPQVDTYIVDGRTGNLVQCSRYFGGRSLAFIEAPSQSVLDLPQPYSSAACEGFSLGKLDPSDATEGPSE